MNMVELIVTYTLLHGIIGAAMLVYIAENGSWFCRTPADIHKTINVNWFGAVVIFLCYLVSTPIYCIIGLLIWLCTVGRKRND